MPSIRNNAEKIMTFNPTKSFYYFVAIKRRKDNPEILEKECETIKAWIIKDLREFNLFYVYQMLETVKNHKCRLYMCTDRKSYSKTMLTIREDIDKHLAVAIENENVQYSPKTLTNLIYSNTMKAESSDKKERKWLFDVDVKDKRLVEVLSKICGEHLEAVFDTKNGYHIIAKRQFPAMNIIGALIDNKPAFHDFDLTQFTKEEISILQENKDNFDIKTNHMALIAMDY